MMGMNLIITATSAIMSDPSLEFTNAFFGAIAISVSSSNQFSKIRHMLLTLAKYLTHPLVKLDPKFYTVNLAAIFNCQNKSAIQPIPFLSPFYIRMAKG